MKCSCGICKRCILRYKLKSTIERNAINQETRVQLMNKGPKCKVDNKGGKRIGYCVDVNKETGKWESKVKVIRGQKKDDGQVIKEGVRQHVYDPKTGHYHHPITVGIMKKNGIDVDRLMEKKGHGIFLKKDKE